MAANATPTPAALQVSAMASVYLQLLIPSLWAFGAVQCVAGYLQVHCLPFAQDPPALFESHTKRQVQIPLTKHGCLRVLLTG